MLLFFKYSSHLLYHLSILCCFTSLVLIHFLQYCTYVHYALFLYISGSLLVYRKAIGSHIFILYHKYHNSCLLKNFFMSLTLFVQYILNLPLYQTLWVLTHITIFLFITIYYFCIFLNQMFLK